MKSFDLSWFFYRSNQKSGCGVKGGVVQIIAATELVKILFEEPNKMAVYFLDSSKHLYKKSGFSKNMLIQQYVLLHLWLHSKNIFFGPLR